MAIEMHASQLVYSVPGLLRLCAAIGDTIGANVDPGHLLWMGTRPVPPRPGSATDAVADVCGLRRVDHADDLQLDARRQHLE